MALIALADLPPPPHGRAGLKFRCRRIELAEFPILGVESVERSVSVSCRKVHKAQIVEMIRSKRMENTEGVAAGICNPVEVEHGGVATRARWCAAGSRSRSFRWGRRWEMGKPGGEWVFLKVRVMEVD